MGSSLLALFTAAGLSGSSASGRSWSRTSCSACRSWWSPSRPGSPGLDSRLEQAAMDLYANEWQTFWRITFPLVFPGILAAALLSFSLSFDDFIVTNFNHGNTITFPMFVWGVRPARHPAAGQRGRHGDVPGRARAGARRRAAPAAARGAGVSARDCGAASWPTPPLGLLARRPGAARRGCRALHGPESADLVVVGGGYTGLWAALRAKERDPDRTCPARGGALRRPGQRPQRRVRVREPDPRLRQRRWPAGPTRWRRWTGWARRTSRHRRHRRRLGIDCAGRSRRAQRRDRAARGRRAADSPQTAGRRPRRPTCSTRTQVRAEVDSRRTSPGCGSPTAAHSSSRPGWPGGCGRRASTPASGSTRAPRTALDERRAGAAPCARRHGEVRARQVVLGTNAFPPLLRRLRLMTVPVYDYVLMTEPLSAGQKAAVGWRGRQGVGDASTCSTTTG